MTREEEIKQASENYYNEVKYLSDLSAFPIAAFKAGAEWGDRTMIDKVCEWVKKHYIEYAHNQLGSEYIINDLRKAMEG